MMKILSFPYGLVQANMYVLVFGDEAIVIDPCVPWKRTGLPDMKIRAVLCTHGHFDHISELEEYSSCRIYISKEDRDMLSDPDLNHSTDFGVDIRYEGDVRVFEKTAYTHEDFGISEHFSLEIISVPGHTSGSVCLLFKGDDGIGHMFTGDMLFAGSVGRTDLGGSESDMIRSIRFLSEMPDDILCYPGHGEKTDLAREKQFNPYFRFFK